jgi:hypothetical protein
MARKSSRKGFWRSGNQGIINPAHFCNTSLPLIRTNVVFLLLMTDVVQRVSALDLNQ